MGDLPVVLGGTSLRAGKAWPRWPQWDAAERAGLLGVLESGDWWTGAGTEAAAFATEMAHFHDARYGLAVTNGTHALEAALVACGVGAGDEVIVPALTFVATATAVLAAKATPVVVDIDPDSLCIDVDAAEAAITPRTRAIIAVHVAGAACDLDALTDLCTRRSVQLVEDCAHAHGTRWRGRGVGGFGSFGTFSFQASKLMTAGEGGAIVTNDDTLRARAQSYINCGRVEGEHWYHHATYGTNLRMTEWQGAVLRAQLARFPEQHRVRNDNARLLDGAIAEIPGLRPQGQDARMDSQGRYCYVFHYDAREFASLPLDAFEAALAAEGVVHDVSYPSLSRLALFRHESYARTWSVPRAERAASSTVWLEHRMLLAPSDDVLDIARAAARIHAHAGAVAREAADRRAC